MDTAPTIIVLGTLTSAHRENNTPSIKIAVKLDILRRNSDNQGDKLQNHLCSLHIPSQQKSMLDGTFTSFDEKWKRFSDQVNAQFKGNEGGRGLEGIDSVGRLENSHEIPEKSHEIQYESLEIPLESFKISEKSLEIQYESLEIPYKSHEIQSESHEIQTASIVLKSNFSCLYLCLSIADSYDIMKLTSVAPGLVKLLKNEFSLSDLEVTITFESHEIQSESHEIRNESHEIHSESHKIHSESHKIQSESHEIRKDLMRLIFESHLYGHPRHAMVSRVKDTIPKLKWKTKENLYDCGIFTMLHMENFNGGPASDFDYGLPVESQLQLDILRRLRFKFAMKILLHEINLQSEKMVEFAKEFDKKGPSEKISIIIDAIKNREECDHIDN
ncbi:ulp1 protease family, C-terminal catalytic domain-containing protein [Tanacetum coccineum]